MQIKSGSGSTQDGSKYRWANTDQWRIVHWPDYGGVEAMVKIIGFGWCIDTRDCMPPVIRFLLLDAVGVPNKQLA